MHHVRGLAICALRVTVVWIAPSLHTRTVNDEGMRFRGCKLENALEENRRAIQTAMMRVEQEEKEHAGRNV